MLRHNYTVVLIQIEHNFLLGTKVNSENEIEKAACFGWLRYFKAIRLVSDGYSSSLPNYGTYTNEKSLSHCRDQGSS